MQAATLLSITVAGGLAIAVIGLKYEVAHVEDDLARVNRSILNEQRAIHVLKAEWVHLNDPARLSSLASELLGMRPVDPTRIRTFDDLPMRAPAPAPEAQPAPGVPTARAPAAVSNGEDVRAEGERLPDDVTYHADRRSVGG